MKITALQCSRRLQPAWRGRTHKGCGYTFAICAIVLLSSCATTPRVIEVTSRTRLRSVAQADRRLFEPVRASHISYHSYLLPTRLQREEFYVHWCGADVDRVKFEYRQLNVPDTIKEESVVLESSAEGGIVGRERPSEAPGFAPTPAATPTKPTTLNLEPGTVSHVFEVRGDDFVNGGPVSAWRVSLWSGDRLLAERKSALW